MRVADDFILMQSKGEEWIAREGRNHRRQGEELTKEARDKEFLIKRTIGASDFPESQRLIFEAREKRSPLIQRKN